MSISFVGGDRRSVKFGISQVYMQFPTFSQNTTFIQAYWQKMLYYLFSPVVVSYKVWANFVWSKSKRNILDILLDLKIHI